MLALAPPLQRPRAWSEVPPRAYDEDSLEGARVLDFTQLLWDFAEGAPGPEEGFFSRAASPFPASGLREAAVTTVSF